MKTQKILPVIILAAFAGMWIFYMQFSNANRVEEIQQAEPEVIRILAPYETKLHQQILEEIADEYNRKDESVQFEFEFVPRENIKKELVTRSLAGKESVDIVICDNMQMPELISMGILKELSISADLYDRVQKSQMWNSTRKDGKIYGIPFTCDPYVLFYRADVLENSGQELPNTWEDLLQFSIDTKKTDVTSLGVAGKREDEATNLYRLMVYSMGGNFRTIDQETGIQAYEMLQKMSRYGVISKDMMNYTEEDLAREFAEGGINMMINRLSSVTILRTNQVSFQVEIGKVPDDEVGGAFLYGENLGLTADADSRAWQFVQYMIEEDVYERICNAMDTLPVFSDTEYKVKKKIYMEDAMELVDEARIFESYSSWTKISEAVAEGVYEMVETSRADAAETAISVQNQVSVAIMKE